MVSTLDQMQVLMGQDQVSGRVSLLCLLAASVAMFYGNLPKIGDLSIWFTIILAYFVMCWLYAALSLGWFTQRNSTRIIHFENDYEHESRTSVTRFHQTLIKQSQIVSVTKTNCRYALYLHIKIVMRWQIRVSIQTMRTLGEQIDYMYYIHYLLRLILLGNRHRTVPTQDCKLDMVYTM